MRPVGGNPSPHVPRQPAWAACAHLREVGRLDGPETKNLQQAGADVDRWEHTAACYHPNPVASTRHERAAHARHSLTSTLCPPSPLTSRMYMRCWEVMQRMAL